MAKQNILKTPMYCGRKLKSLRTYIVIARLYYKQSNSLFENSLFRRSSNEPIVFFQQNPQYLKGITILDFIQHACYDYQQKTWSLHSL